MAINREIKFRVYNTRQEKWVEHPVLVQLSDGWGVTGQIYVDPETNDKITEATWESFKDDIDDVMKDIVYPNHKACDYVLLDFADADMICGDYEVMQYTGMEDKNGQEIYTGDILDWGGEIVEAKIENAHLLGRNEDRAGYIYEEFLADIKVIGNKFEDNDIEIGGD